MRRKLRWVTMLRFAYSLTLYITYPLWSAWMRRRAAKRNEQPNWNERFGNYPNLPSKTGKRTWFHAVSVGEVVAAKPIIEQYRRLNPDVAIVLSTTTSSGHNMAKQLGISDHLIYFPVDLPHVCRRAMRQVNPDFVLILETELWFNFLFSQNGKAQSLPCSMAESPTRVTLMRPGQRGYTERCSNCSTNV